MKREFLENLGLERDSIDSIMSENGKSIQALKEKCSTLEAENSELTSRLSEAEKLKEELSSLSAELEVCKNNFLKLKDNAIQNAVKNAGFSSLSAEKTAILLMNEAVLNGENLFEVIDSLKESDPDAFLTCVSAMPIFSSPATECNTSFGEAKISYINRRF